MYKVEWLDDNGEIRVKRNFKTSEEVHEWIRNNNFDLNFEMPMVLYDGDDLNRRLNMDKNKIEITEVWSANKLYLVCGIISIILFVLLEFAAIRELFVSNNKMEAFVLLFICQMPALICLLFTTTIKDYINRTKFNIYCCKLKNGIDIDYIKENYYIGDIDKDYILFVDKENEHNFRVWNLFHGYDSI